MANFIIPLEVVQKIVGYLGTRPYAEVFQLIAALGTCKTDETTESPEEPKRVE